MQALDFETVDSTNEQAKRLIRAGELRGSGYVLAREQTAGKGSRGRSWLSPKDAGIYLSVVEIPRERNAPATTALTLAAGVACAEALRQTAGIDVQLKPINDLYVYDGKLGGILTETLIRDGAPEAIITGVGINVRRVDRPLPGEAAAPTCLEELMSPPRFDRLDQNLVVATLVARIHHWNHVILSGNADAVRTAWEKYKRPGTAFPCD